MEGAAASASANRFALALRLLPLVVVACGRFGFDPLTAGDGSGSGTGDGGFQNGDALPVTSPRSITVGERFTCAVLDDGSLWCWGDGRVPALAFAGVAAILPPTRVGTDSDWARVGTDTANVCAIKQNGTLWCMGAAIGDGTTLARPMPTQLGTATDWLAIDGRQRVTCGLRAGGVAWCWGDNTNGAVGNGVTGGSVTSPVAVMTAQRFDSIAVADHVCAVSTASLLWCWGSNSVGALGDGTGNSYSTPVQIGSAQWLSVGVELYRSWGVQANGSLWRWGSFNGGGSSPSLVDAAGWTDVTVSLEGMCGHRGTDLWCLGDNGRGGLAAGAATTLSNTTQVDPGPAFGQIAMHDSVICAVRDGALSCSGIGAYGQLGDGVVRWASAPRPVPGGAWQQVSVGRYTACAIAADSTLWCWGNSNYQQLTSAYPNGSAEPVQIGQVASWVDVAVGGQSVAAVRADHTLWYWGQLTGPGITSTPTQIGSASWNTIDMRDSHACGIQLDNTAWCVGDNPGGALGNNSLMTSATPVQAGNATYTRVVTGVSSSYGIQLDQSLWAWGSSYTGQLGDGSTMDHKSPVKIATGTTWIDVSGGSTHACGVRTNGTLWCWGDNAAGQLGDGTTTQRLSPTQVGTSTSWASVTAGSLHTCALDTGGALWCWGRNDEGQLGNGTYADERTPIQIGSATWAEVSTGTLDGGGYALFPDSMTTCGRDTAGTLRCWGDNSDGVIGDGTGWSTTFQPVMH